MIPDPDRLALLLYPDPILRRRAEPTPLSHPDLPRVIDAMVRIMRAERGIGLAAPQVGVPWRLFILDVPADDDNPARADPPRASDGLRVYINPVITPDPLPPVIAEEGCLSLPDIRGDVPRPPAITVRAADPSGADFEHRAAGLLARCIQHEYDHLEGVLIIDRFTQMSRMKNRRALRDLARRAEAG